MILLSNGDEKEKNRFEEIYHTYSRYLYAIGLKILKDEDFASDALQQCYFRIYQNIDKMKDINSKQTRSSLGIIMRDESLMIYNQYSSIDKNDSKEEIADLLNNKFDRWEEESPNIRVPKDAEFKILDMADSFNKLRSREEKRKRLRKYVLVTAIVTIIAIAILTILYIR